MDMRTDGKQTKKFRLPLFDIALLLLIAIAVAGASYWVSTRGDTETAVVEYTVRFEQVDNSYSGALAQAKELFSTSGLSMGEVVTSRVTRSTEQTFDLHTSYVEGGGLSTLRRRVEQAGGKMAVQSLPQFKLTVTVPKRKDGV